MQVEDLRQLVSYTKYESLNPDDIRLYCQIASNIPLRTKFESDIQVLSASFIKPEEVLRRFNLDGDGHLDFREFQLAMRRLGSKSEPRDMYDLFRAFCSRTRRKLDITLFCQIMAYWSLDRATQVEGEIDYEENNHESLESKAFKNMRSSITRAEAIIQQKKDKLSDLFLQMDIECNGEISAAEFRFGLEHLGIHLNELEFQHFMNELPSHVKSISPEVQAPSINYIRYLHSLTHDGQESFGIHKIWDTLVLHVDKLEKYFGKMIKMGECRVSNETFRQGLCNCGISMSTHDFSALRMKFQLYTDSDGKIRIDQILDALQNSNNPRLSVGSPKKRGKKWLASPRKRDGGVQAAGRTTEDREHARPTLRMQEDHSKPSNFKERFLQDDTAPMEQTKGQLETRIMDKLARLKSMGSFSSLQSYFPGDRFGKITRGQFRQSLAHVGEIARYAEVENLFWQLDPHGRGYVSMEALHSHLSKFQRQISKSTKPRPPPLILEEDQNSETAHRKIIDQMMNDVEKIIQACEKLDHGHVGLVTKDEFLWALKEAGVILSSGDANKAVSDLSGRRDGVVAYKDLEANLLGKCSTLLSPRNKSKHLSLASAVIQHDDQVEARDPVLPVFSPRNNNRSSIDLSTRHDDSDTKPGTLKDNLERRERQRNGKAESTIEMLQSKRHILKSCFIHYSTCVHDDVLTREELQMALQSSRLDLNLSSDEAKMIVDLILPTNVQSTTYHDFVRYLGSYSVGSAASPRESPQYKVVRRRGPRPPTPMLVSIRKKVNETKRLENLNTPEGCKTAGVVIRHAFRSASFEGFVIACGKSQFDGACRCVDLARICRKLGLYLEPEEAQHISSEIGHNDFVSSSDLLAYFIQLIQSSD